MEVAGEDIHGSTRFRSAIAGHQPGYRSQPFSNHIKRQCLTIMINRSRSYAYTGRDWILCFEAHRASWHKRKAKAARIGPAVRSELPHLTTIGEQLDVAEGNRSGLVRLQEMTLYCACTGQL